MVRGKQLTDSNGVAYSHTCYPVWTRSRTVHVHFIVTVDGRSTLTLDDDVTMTQPLDKTRDERDTTNQDDNGVPADQIAASMFSTQRMTDGGLLPDQAILISRQACALDNGLPRDLPLPIL